MNASKPASLLLLCSSIVLSSCGGGGGDGGNNGGGNNGGGNSSSGATFAAAVSAQGTLSSSQQGASYSITVSVSSSGETSGTTTLTSSPTGFSITAMSGTNWQCTAGTGTCTSTLGVSGQTFPPITVTGNVTAANGGQVMVPVTVSGGGTPSLTLSPVPTIAVAGPSLTPNSSHSGNFVQGQQGASYTVGVTNGASAGATSGKVVLTDTVPPGETLVFMSGIGWNCPGAEGANTCDRSDTLATGASYPSVTVIVNVAVNASSPQTNQVSVSGGGMANPVPGNDPTVVASLPAGDDLAIVLSHLGSFVAGSDGVFNMAVSNVGTASTTGKITVSDTLPAQLTFVSGAAAGWSCSAAGQVVTCMNSGPVAAGASLATIPLVVALSGSANGSISTTATVATAGDADAGNNSSTDTAAVVTPASVPSVAINLPGPVFAGGNTEAASILVSNDQSADILNPALSIAGAACGAAACGSLGAISVSEGAFTYPIPYTPPASVGAATNVTMTASSSLANSIPATVNFTVNPAGVRLITVPGPGQKVMVGSAAKTNTSAVVYYDTGNPGITLQLLAAGHTCPTLASGTVCGTLSVGAVTPGTTSTGTTGITTTSTAFSYTPPASVPNPPYDVPMIIAVSKADATKISGANFPLTANTVTNLVIGAPSRLNTALTNAAPYTVSATLTSDSGVNKTIVGTLSAGGASCQPQCGTLSAPVYTVNGSIVNVSFTYTPPSSVPAGTAATPTLTLTSVDVINAAEQSDSFSFQIIDGTCGAGNNGVLNGQYAFISRGGGAGGYLAVIGTFTADGSGNITGGSLDTNSTNGPVTGLSIVPGTSSYSIGSDNRGCLVLGNSNGGFSTYRIALGSLDGSNHATQGAIIRFDDSTGDKQRAAGILLKQDPTSFAGGISGNYVVGEEGVDSTGGRIAVAGVYTADGQGNLTHFDLDTNDNGSVTANSTGGSATYSSFNASTGRGTSTFTSGAVTTHAVEYLVNASEFLSMTTDALSQSTPVLSGDNRKQTTSSYTQTSLDGKAYVLFAEAIGPSNGGNIVAIGQTKVTTNGADSGELDSNDNGAVAEQALSSTLNIAANGRAPSADGTVVFYLIGTDSAFFIGTDNTVNFGSVQQQSAGPFSNASLSGSFAVGGGSPSAGGSYDSGTGTFDGVGTLDVTLDDQSPHSQGHGPAAYTYSVTSATSGKFSVVPAQQGSSGALGFIISGTEFVLISVGTDPGDPELIIGKH